MKTNEQIEDLAKAEYPKYHSGFISEQIQLDRSRDRDIKAFIKGFKARDEMETKPTELQLKEAYNLGVYRGKCQILYPTSKDAFVTFDEYYKSLPTPPKQ